MKKFIELTVAVDPLGARRIESCKDEFPANAICMAVAMSVARFSQGFCKNRNIWEWYLLCFGWPQECCIMSTHTALKSRGLIGRLIRILAEKRSVSDKVLHAR